MQTFVFVLTKNEPIRRRYILTPDLQEQMIEEEIEDFEPYSRVVYVHALEEIEAQRKLYDHMKKYGLFEWRELPDGLLIR